MIARETPVPAHQRPGCASLWSAKIQPRHLERMAIVYVRQSTPQQVLHHRESTELQYRLAERARDLGWPDDRVCIIDDDLGLSGRSIEGRSGFQRLLAEVSLDRVGLILGIEMSRLARSCKDWYHLLEICALFGTLLADQDGLYDPCNYNDRLLLGLKGTMSEAELHILKSRMLQGKLNKAARGELFSHPPAGYMREEQAGMVLEPDEQARHVVQVVFEKFAELGSINAVLRYLNRNDIRLGMRPHFGSDKGHLVWRAPARDTLRSMLRNPLYAGAYAYGRHKTDPKRQLAGTRSSGRWEADAEQWTVLLKDRLPAYITWEQYERNLTKLADNQARAKSVGTPRNGEALLGGILHCARCGGRMSASYGGRHGGYRYSCDRNGSKNGGRGCQGIRGQVVDQAVAEQVLEALKPAALELSCQAAVALEQERKRLDRHWRQRLQRAGYDVQLAQRRYEAVDPANRLVAQSLENAWEAALSVQREVEQAHQRFLQEQPGGLSAEQQHAVLALAQDIPALWHAETTQPADRQQMVRLLVERVTVDTRGQCERVEIAIRWRGGFESRQEVRRAVACFEQLHDFAALLERAKALRSSGHSSRSIAEILDAEGFSSPRGNGPLSDDSVRLLLARSPTQAALLRRRSFNAWLAADERWLTDLADELELPYVSLHAWIGRGWLRARKIAEAGGMVAVKADAQEMDRLRKLLAHRRQFPHQPPPPELVRTTRGA